MSRSPASARFTGINELLENFRDALRALVPVAGRAHIAWRDGEAYDDWDDLASCAYDVLVARPIIADASGGTGVLPLAPYDMLLPDYGGVSCLVVAREPESLLVFHRLLAGDAGFGNAEVRPIGRSGRLLDVQPVAVPIGSVSWRLLRRQLDRSSELVDRIAVEI